MSKFWETLKIIGIVWLLSSVASMFFIGDDPSISQNGNIAVIRIYGPISVEEASGFGASGTSSELIISQLEKAEQNPNIKAVLLDINSPGGSGVAADEIGQKIKSMNKTTVAVVREIGTSAAYWIASTTDYIFANRLSITGSIGVIGSYLDFSGLIEEYNVTYRRYVSGEYKDMGSPFKEPSADEVKLYQDIINKMESFFIKEVSENRKLSVAKVEKLATGQIYLGTEAKDLGLIDALGTKEDAIAFIENKYNITAELVEYKEKKGFYDLLTEFSGKKIGTFINSGPSFEFR